MVRVLLVAPAPLLMWAAAGRSRLFRGGRRNRAAAPGSHRLKTMVPMPRAAAPLPSEAVSVALARAAPASAARAKEVSFDKIPVPAGRGRGAASARAAKRLARKVAQGTVLAAGLVALQLGTLDSDPRERLFDLTVIDRLESPLTHFRD